MIGIIVRGLFLVDGSGKLVGYGVWSFHDIIIFPRSCIMFSEEV